MTSVIVVDSVTLEFVNIFPVGANGAIVMGPNPQVSFETTEDPSVLVAVKDTETGEIALQADPAKVAAKEAQTWSTLRTQRNSLLQQSDWTQLQDAHLSAEKKSAWADYRQALRDLPDTVTITSPVDWPQINTPS